MEEAERTFQDMRDRIEQIVQVGKKDGVANPQQGTLKAAEARVQQALRVSNRAWRES